VDSAILNLKILNPLDSSARRETQISQRIRSENSATFLISVDQAMQMFLLLLKLPTTLVLTIIDAIEVDLLDLDDTPNPPPQQQQAPQQ
jgi:hypothetical protein